jgi:hypothetical protein
MKTAHGFITFAQEQRFQLVDDQGVKRLFIVAHGSAVEGKDLGQLEASHLPVTVFYTDNDMLSGHTAHDVHERQ